MPLAKHFTEKLALFHKINFEKFLSKIFSTPKSMQLSIKTDLEKQLIYLPYLRLSKGIPVKVPLETLCYNAI